VTTSWIEAADGSLVRPPKPGAYPDAELTGPYSDQTVQVSFEVDSCGCVGQVTVDLTVEDRRAWIAWLMKRTTWGDA
jgi:hypothetical protein